MKGPKNDKIGLDRLLKLSVLGSAIIVVVYSVYYYSNAYRYSRSNILHLDQTAGTHMASLGNKVLVLDDNILLSDNLSAAAFQSVDGWKPAHTHPGYTLNSSTTVALSGSIGQGFYDRFTAELTKKFQAIPPFQKSALHHGISIRSVHFEHFAFPYHAMIAWHDRSLPYHFFQFSCDSLGTGLVTYNNGFAWTSNGPHGGYITVYNCAKGDSVAAGKTNFGPPQAYAYVKMPVVDFDAIYSDKNWLSAHFYSNGDSLRVVDAVGELKILIGPSLKQREAYELPPTSTATLSIVPPFVVSLHKDGTQAPYVICVVANGDLLLK